MKRMRLALPRQLWRLPCRKIWKEQQMKYFKIVLVVLVAMAMTSPAIAITARAYSMTIQGQSTALERGYRTGYSDGYSAGSRDVSDHAARNYQSKDEYQRGDRSYNQAWGTAEDYRDGYQQGFEVGYAAGYDRRLFNSSVPTDLKRRDKTVDTAPTTEPNNAPSTDPNTRPNDDQNTSNGSGSAVG